MRRELTIEEVQEILINACSKTDSIRAWAEEHGIPSGRVCEVINGVRLPTTAICDALGLERVVVYRRRRREKSLQNSGDELRQESRGEPS